MKPTDIQISGHYPFPIEVGPNAGRYIIRRAGQPNSLSDSIDEWIMAELSACPSEALNVKVNGKTFPVKDALKNLGFSFRNYWCASVEKRETPALISAVLKLGCQIEIWDHPASMAFPQLRR